MWVRWIVVDYMRRLLTRRNALLALGLVMVAVILTFAARHQKAAAAGYFTASVETGPLRNVVNKQEWF